MKKINLEIGDWAQSPIPNPQSPEFHFNHLYLHFYKKFMNLNYFFFIVLNYF